MRTGCKSLLLFGLAVSLTAASSPAQVLKGSTPQTATSSAASRATASNGTAGPSSGGSSGPATSSCIVQEIRLRLGTGGDDLRGGDNNLNVTIHFARGYLPAPNVNNRANWPNNSVHTVTLPLVHPVPASEIKNITLDHLANGGLTVSGATVFSPVGVLAGLQTADNWDMAYLQGTAVGPNLNARIASYRFYRFTGSNPVLNIATETIPDTACGGSGSGEGVSSGGTGNAGSVSSGGSGLASAGNQATSTNVGPRRTMSAQTNSMSAQVLKGSSLPTAAPSPAPAVMAPQPAANSSIKWSITSAVVEALLHSVQAAPKLTINGSSQIMSASTATPSGTNPGATAVQQSNAPTAHHPNVPPATQLEETKLASIPLAAVQLAHVSDGKGQAVGAQLTSPTAVALPNHTIGIYRDDDAAPFSGGTDVINLTGYLKTGFQISKVMLYTAELTNISCQSVPPGGGQFSTNGSWFVPKPALAQFSVMWQEDSCAVRSDGPNNPDWGATSIYALDIYVVGPKGEQALNPSYVNAAPPVKIK